MALILGHFGDTGLDLPVIDEGLCLHICQTLWRSAVWTGLTRSLIRTARSEFCGVGWMKDGKPWHGGATKRANLRSADGRPCRLHEADPGSAEI
ncbi:hypothetical protein QA639_09195 [Bradyrhizobium pachyrhizi]|uniref:hypothetical protein n=1 Tax=Bradyrhizobium pachyrhizi TaxID=280333 RepID=UPI0024B0BDB5|nr:hypothetical protein [Bradyrhizobium pachyrhizi]WFU57668.1 hypothetical protein QA639_09195 [Bradyrhizobium pachyrhizi]